MKWAAERLLQEEGEHFLGCYFDLLGTALVFIGRDEQSSVAWLSRKQQIGNFEDETVIDNWWHDQSCKDKKDFENPADVAQKLHQYVAFSLKCGLRGLQAHFGSKNRLPWFSSQLLIFSNLACRIKFMNFRRHEVEAVDFVKDFENGLFQSDIQFLGNVWLQNQFISEIYDFK